MTWEKVTVQDAMDRWSFSDQYGFSYFSVESVHLKIGTNWENLSDLYKKEGNIYKRLKNYKPKIVNLFKFLKKFFDDEWAVSIYENHLSSNFSLINLFNFCIINLFKYSWDMDILTKNKVRKINVKDMNAKINLQITTYSNDPNERDKSNIECEIEINNIEDFNKIDFLNGDEKVDFWIPIGKTIRSGNSPIRFGNSPLEYFDRPNIKDVQIGDKYFYLPKNSICEVVKKYDYPEPDERLYDVKLADKSIVTIKYGKDNDLLVLPYVKTKPKSDVLDFNTSINKFNLQPYVEYEIPLFMYEGKGMDSIGARKTYHVYWQEIKNAAKYTVSVYKMIKFSNRSKVYHLKDVEVDKNEKKVTIHGLVGGNFVFVVKAEDRNSNVLAFSRCIEDGDPQWWGVDDD